MKINPFPNPVDINPDLKTGMKTTPPGTDAVQKPGFDKIFMDALKQTNQMQMDADQAIGNLVTGKNKELHTTMIAMEKAGISLSLMLQVRDKVVEAYQQIMRMQI